MNSKIKYYVICFLFGFFGYGLMEVIWRNYTHPTMSLAGGLAFIFISLVSEKLKELNTLYKAILCGGFITIIELAIGLIMNVGLSKGIWDYSQTPLNFMGQICLTFSVIWCFISVPFMKFSLFLKARL